VGSLPHDEVTRAGGWTFRRLGHTVRMQITALSGGIGGARFVRGLLHHLQHAGLPDERLDVTVIGNTADDIWLFGLKVCPDLDTLMYTLGGGIDEQRGWGRSGEGWRAKEELTAYGVQPDWFGLGDRDLATHVVRTQMLSAGYTLSEVTDALCARWQPGVRLLPMSDDRVETHIVIDDADAPSGRRTVHFQEYWVRLRANVPARAVIAVGAPESAPAPGVIEALSTADLIVLPPSNPVVSIGTILQVPGVRTAIGQATAPVVGVSPIVAGAPVRGMADAMLSAVGVDTTAGAVALHYGPRAERGILDAWLVDESDAASVAEVEAAGIRCLAVPLLMHDLEATAAMAADVFALARAVGG
jgi:LPPG:FO 2-phospho-L-lactate transferase